MAVEGAVLALRVDAREGMERVRRSMEKMPSATERALHRALRKLANWLRRQTLRAASEAARLPQQYFRRALRYYTQMQRDAGRLTGVSVWVGTNPVPVHRAARVRWTRRMRGARVGRVLYPGTWSWGPAGKTGPAVMRRIGERQSPIERVDVDIHPAVLARLRGVQAEAEARFERLLAQELRYALEVETAG